MRISNNFKKHLSLYLVLNLTFASYAGDGFAQCFPAPTGQAGAANSGNAANNRAEEKIKFYLHSFQRESKPVVEEKDYLFEIKDMQEMHNDLWKGVVPAWHHNALAQGNVNHFFVKSWVFEFLGRLDSKQHDWTYQFINECETANHKKITEVNYNWRMLACFAEKISETTKILDTHNNGFFDEEMFRSFCSLAAKLFEVTVSNYQKKMEDKYGRMQEIFRAKVYTYVAALNQCSMHVYNRVRVYVKDNSYPGGLRPFYYSIDVGNRPKVLYVTKDTDASQVVSCETRKINRLADFMTHPNLDFPYVDYIDWYSLSALKHHAAIQNSIANGSELTLEQQLPVWKTEFKTKDRVDSFDWAWVKQLPIQLTLLGHDVDWFYEKVTPQLKRKGLVQPPPAYFNQICTNN